MERPPLRKYLMEGDFFSGVAIGSTMTKLALRFSAQVPDQSKQNRFAAEWMLIISSILHLGSSGLPEKAITKDDADRLQLCLKVLCDRSSLLCQIFNVDCREALGQMLQAQIQVESNGTSEESQILYMPKLMLMSTSMTLSLTSSS